MRRKSVCEGGDAHNARSMKQRSRSLHQGVRHATVWMGTQTSDSNLFPCVVVRRCPWTDQYRQTLRVRGRRAACGGNRGRPLADAGNEIVAVDRP